MATKTETLLHDLTKDKLESYIVYLTSKYYSTYLEGDVEGHRIVIEQLYFILNEYDVKYDNLEAFICFYMYINANKTIMQEHDKAIMLNPLFKVGLSNDDVNELAFDIKNIFNKERIKERYECKRKRQRC